MKKKDKKIMTVLLEEFSNRIRDAVLKEVRIMINQHEDKHHAPLPPVLGIIEAVNDASRSSSDPIDEAVCDVYTREEVA